MNIKTEEDTIVLRLTSEEAERLAVALWADHETVSRAEYFIRYGLSRPEVRQLADAINEAGRGNDGDRSLRLAPGVEKVENPRRPRPGE